MRLWSSLQKTKNPMQSAIEMEWATSTRSNHDVCHSTVCAHEKDGERVTAIRPGSVFNGWYQPAYGPCLPSSDTGTPAATS